jgi:hypothetical protein
VAHPGLAVLTLLPESEADGPREDALLEIGQRGLGAADRDRGQKHHERPQDRNLQVFVYEAAESVSS